MTASAPTGRSRTSDRRTRATTSRSSAPASSAPRSRASWPATELSVALLEARGDVGDGTSKANTALLHTGYDATPGTLESRLVARGYQLLSDYAAQHRHPDRAHRRAARRLERGGARRAARPQGQGRAQRLRRAARSSTPPRSTASCRDLGPGALGALTVPDESIICTWTTSLALATDARLRGAELLLDHRVDRRRGRPPTTPCCTRTGGDGQRPVRGQRRRPGRGHRRRLFGHHRFTVTPRRGELLVFDKLSRPLVDRIVLAVPTTLGKGVLISPTIYGNVMLGPTAENLDRQDRHRHLRGRLRVPARQGQDADAAAVRRRGHRHLRRAASDDRPATTT